MVRVIKEGDIVVCLIRSHYGEMYSVIERYEDKRGKGMLKCENQSDLQWFAEENLRLATVEEKDAMLTEFLLL